MEDKEIEQMLKDSADKIKMKDFSERWEVISDRINESQTGESREKVQSAVLVTSANKTVTENTVRKKIIFSVCSVFAIIVICLAIVLPMVLGKNKEKKYLFQDLTNSSVSESDFYNAVEESELKLLDLSDFDISGFVLFYTEDGKTVGSSVILTEEELGAYIKLVFYTNIVKSNFEIGTDYEEYTVNGYKIIYNTENSKDIYTTKAKATKSNMVYELEILSIDDNLESLYDRLFN